TIDAHNHGFFKRLFRLIPGDILHPHQFDEPEYAAMLTSRGFSITDTRVMEKEFFFSRVMHVAKKNATQGLSFADGASSGVLRGLQPSPQLIRRLAGGVLLQ